MRYLGNAAPNVQIRKATISDLEELTSLFDGYRQFYGRTSDLNIAHSFLLQRFSKRQSVIFLAEEKDDNFVGFTQLFPSFSSVSAAQIFILNDLFVVPSARRRGVASALINAAADFAREAGAIRLSLSTGVSNKEAQALYEKSGWSRDQSFYVYHLPINI